MVDTWGLLSKIELRLGRRLGAAEADRSVSAASDTLTVPFMVEELIEADEPDEPRVRPGVDRVLVVGEGLPRLERHEGQLSRASRNLQVDL